MKGVLILSFLFCHSLAGLAQARDLEAKLDSAYRLILDLQKKLKPGGGAKTAASEKGKKTGNDSAALAEKIKRIEQTDAEIGKREDLITKKQDELKNLVSDTAQFYSDQKTLAEEDIKLALKNGSKNSPEFLGNLKPRSDMFNPAKAADLQQLTRLTDSFNAIRKILDYPYNAGTVAQGRARLNAMMNEAEKNRLPSLHQDMKALDTALSYYCDHTNKVYEVFKKAYPLRNDDATQVGQKFENSAFWRELIKAAFYVQDYPYLVKLLNEFLQKADVREKYKNAEQKCPGS